MSTIYNVIFPAGHNTNLRTHDNNVAVNAAHSRQIDAKLDVQHRNNYNRTNHRFDQDSLHNPQIVVGDDDYATESALKTPTNHDSYWNSSTRFISGSQSTLVGCSSLQGASAISSVRTGSLSAGASLDDPNTPCSTDNRRFTERRKKTVRFDGQESNDWTRWDSERQNSQDSTTRDSGIDTSSTFTSSEDSNRGDGPKVSHTSSPISKKKKYLFHTKIQQKKMKAKKFTLFYFGRIRINI